MSAGYHDSEAQILANREDPRRLVPSYDCAGWRVLDVGCGEGQTLAAPELIPAQSRTGIDIDAEAIEHAVQAHPGLKLLVAGAEDIPLFTPFDLVFSRVALPYTDIRLALAEMSALTARDGHVWITWHTWATERSQLSAAIRTLSLKRFIDRLYVIGNSLLFALTGRVLRRPWNGRIESVQTEGSIRRALKRAGLKDIRIKRNRWHLLSTARKP